MSPADKSESERRSARDCFWVLAALALSMGVGTIWGAGYGWLGFGGFCIFALVEDSIEQFIKSKANQE